MYMLIRVLSDLNHKLIPSFRGSYWQSYTLLFIYFVLYLFIYIFFYLSIFIYLFIYIFIYLFIYLFIVLLCLCYLYFFINYSQFSSLYCYNPALIMTCILNQIVYIKPCL